MAGAIDLTVFAVRLLRGEAALRQALHVPLLVWEDPPETSASPMLLGTESGQPATRAKSGKPVVFEVKKTEQNVFGQGSITVGRTANNDIAIDDNSVSRFHAYFMPPSGKQPWQVFDADSKLGTWVDGNRLPARKGTPVADRSRVRVGHVQLHFYAPGSFVDWLMSVSGKS
jgi:pSer/pThr/pTyr-binding forkhead associated (FHA) protein